MEKVTGGGMITSKIISKSLYSNKVIRSCHSSGSSLGTGLLLEGRHNADKAWISELRTRGDVMVIEKAINFFLCISSSSSWI